MNIGIDARFFGATGKGLGRYTQKLIENLEKVSAKGGPASGGDHRFFIFLRKENFEEYQPKNPNFQKVLADYSWYGLSEQINMPRILNKYDLDLVHFPHFNVPLFYRKKFIITIHDLILLHFPTVKNTTLNPLFYWLKFWVYRIVIKSAILRAKKIIAVSEFTKNDIVQNYKIPKSKIAVTYEALENFCEIPSQNENEILEKYGLPSGRHGIIKPYLLYVGNAYPHKNLESFVLSYQEIKKKIGNLNLVLVGKEDYFYRQLKDFTKDQKITNVIFPDFIPDNDLDLVYKNAVLFVFPSLYEGFGLPPLEAMAKGTPVASSNHECMKEILGEAACYFDAKNQKETADIIINLINDEEARKNLVKKGHERIKRYSWEKMAEETYCEYQKLK
jgi:glycosyltransferase involved in cell wall biosynthesis